MKLSIYVPTARAEEHVNDPDRITWGQFQSRVIDAAGGLTLHTAFGRWKNTYGSIVSEPVYIVEVYVTEFSVQAHEVQIAFRDYARQLIRAGEEAVLVTFGKYHNLLTEDNIA